MDQCTNQSGDGTCRSNSSSETQSDEEIVNSNIRPDHVDSSQPEQLNPDLPAWELKTGFKINDRMLEVLQATKKLCEEELSQLRRKLDKLTYGS